MLIVGGGGVLMFPKITVNMWGQEDEDVNGCLMTLQKQESTGIWKREL
jgi:hypothetical protein